VGWWLESLKPRLSVGRLGQAAVGFTRVQDVIGCGMAGILVGRASGIGRRNPGVRMGCVKKGKGAGGGTGVSRSAGPNGQ
jgi:hypothetical protein